MNLFCHTYAFYLPVNTIDVFLTEVIHADAIVVRSAVHQAVPHPEHISLRQQGPAGDTCEASQVKHHVSGSHYQLVSGNPVTASRASLHAE